MTYFRSNRIALKLESENAKSPQFPTSFLQSSARLLPRRFGREELWATLPANRDAESTKDIEQAIARIQARHQASGRATTETKVHRDTETQIESEDSEDSDRLRLNQKDLEGVPFGDQAPTLKGKKDLPPKS